jgi:DNA-binding CsgD family transcriptional regulator
MSERLRLNYHWTERQREVLALMARGKSNSEIGAALDLQLSGVKWHVSEILSKLDAESREEAAEYWRRYNGLAPRFARVFRGALPLASTARAVISVAGVALGAAAMVAIVIWQRGGSGDAASEPSEVLPAVSSTVSSQASVTTGEPIYWALDRGSKGTPDEERVRIYLFGIDNVGVVTLRASDGTAAGWAPVMGSGRFDDASCVVRAPRNHPGLRVIGAVQMDSAAQAAFLAAPATYRAEVDQGGPNAKQLQVPLIDTACRPTSP